MAWPWGPSSTAASSARSLRHAELQLDEVDPEHSLGDRVLDLEPGVHLQEEEALGLPGRRRNSTVPAPTYPIASAALRAAACRRGRDAGVQVGGGRLLDDLLVAPLDRAVALAEHEHLPWVSPTTCTSTWRPCSTYGSTNTVASPKADSASAAACCDLGLREPARSRTTRMPRPPPPALALTSSGRSASLASARAPRARVRRPRASAPWPAPSSPSPRSTPGRVRPRSARPRSRPGRSRRSRRGSRSRDGSRRRRSGAPRRAPGRHAGRSPTARCREVGRRRRPRARTAARRRRRSAPPPSRCRAGGRSRRPGGRSRPGWRREVW